MPPLSGRGETTLLMTADAVGGVWQYAVELARGLLPHGVRTTLLVFGPSPSETQRAEATDIEVAVAGEAPPWMVDDALPAARALASAVGRMRPELVQVNEPALLAGGRLDLPTVAVCHSCLATWWAAVRRGPMPPEFEHRTGWVRRGLVEADRVVAPSAAFAKAVASAYALPAPAVVYNGRSRAAPGPGPRAGIVSAGRLWDEGKGMATLDRAAARLARPVVVAGPLEGPNGAAFAPRHLRAIGTLGDAAMSRFLGGAGIFVSPALYEPFGLTVLEAAQAGCALVLSDIPTFRELWDGAAIFVAPGDADGFADALADLAARPGVRDVLAGAARERTRAYGPQRMAEGYRAIYRALRGARGMEDAA
jgi:glycosyltransferase involved in cell wall biosynthesis